MAGLCSAQLRIKEERGRRGFRQHGSHVGKTAATSLENRVVCVMPGFNSWMVYAIWFCSLRVKIDDCDS